MKTQAAAEDKIRKEAVQRFGDAYRTFGLSKLMGHIIALLILAEKPLSLDDMAKQLKRTKGPISQIVRRLRDHHLIRKVWVPENHRKDYYELQPDVFENAFRNNLALIKQNKRLSEDLLDQANNSPDGMKVQSVRLKEMNAFYGLMIKHYENFLLDWAKQRTKLQKK